MQVTIFCQFNSWKYCFQKQMRIYIGKCSCCGCTPRPISQLATFTYSMMKQITLASNQSLALLGFFPYAIFFSQSQTNDPDPHMFLFKKKMFLGLFFMDGFQLPQGQNHFEEAVYFLPLSSQKLLVLIFYQPPLKGEQRKYRNLIQGNKYRSFS